MTDLAVHTSADTAAAFLANSDRDPFAVFVVCVTKSTPTFEHVKSPDVEAASSWYAVRSLRHQVWLAHGDLPSTEYAHKHAREGTLSGMCEVAPHGHAILTQTCDLVPRLGRDRPFVALAPLVQLHGDDVDQGRRGRRTRFAHVPAFDDGSYFADLDRITTIETGVLLLQKLPNSCAQVSPTQPTVCSCVSAFSIFGLNGAIVWGQSPKSVLISWVPTR